MRRKGRHQTHFLTPFDVNKCATVTKGTNQPLPTFAMKSSFLRPVALPFLTAAGLSLSLTAATFVQPTSRYDRQAAKAAFARPTAVPYPKDNTHSVERVRLGKALFFDPRLSGSNAISCASCHNPAFSWGDGLSLIHI